MKQINAIFAYARYLKAGIKDVVLVHNLAKYECIFLTLTLFRQFSL